MGSKSTDKELVEELTKLDKRKYATIIGNAQRGIYNDLTSKMVSPKTALLNHLAMHPELSGLFDRVAAGEFNERDSDNTQKLSA